MPTEHAKLTTGARVEDAHGRVRPGRRDPRAVRAEDRLVGDARAVADAMETRDADQLVACLGVEDPDAAVGAGGRDARAVGADVYARDGADRSLGPGVPIEEEELLAGLDAPDAHLPLASGGRDEPSAVRRECDLAAACPIRLRSGQREDLTAAGR